MDRARLLAILAQAELAPEPHEFSYVSGGPVFRCVSLRLPLAWLQSHTVKLVRACQSQDEAAELIDRLRYTTDKGGYLILFWSFANWQQKQSKQ